ncbi:MAG: hypothetical protein RL726_661 [Actinomycetota bacterium]
MWNRYPHERAGVDVVGHAVIRNGMRGHVMLATILIGAASCANSSEGDSASSLLPPTSSTAVASTTTTPATTTVATSVPAVAESYVVANFFAPASIDGWFVQNDTVMGGVSSSSVNLDDGAMVFSGILSTDNNGGFTSVRGPLLLDEPSAGFQVIDVMARGDGRTYLMQVRTTTDSYIQRFTPSTVTSISTLPLADFVASDWRLAPLANRPPLTSDAVRQVSVYLVDKREGEFVLRVESITLR